MSERKPGRVKQAAWRNAQRGKGLCEITAWVPEGVRETVQSYVREGRFESQAAAFAHAIERTFGQEQQKTGT
jgi:hypothetical protein